MLSEEVILAEERTTEEERMHIIEGKKIYFKRHNFIFGATRKLNKSTNVLFTVAARRRAAAKKKLKNLGKSKSTDTEEEEQDEECGDDGQYTL